MAEDRFLDEAERLAPAPPVRERSLGRLVRGAVVDLAPMRHRDFRLLWIGQAISFFGSMVTFVAIPYHRRRLVQIAEASLGLAAALLLVNALLPEPRLSVLFVVGALVAGLGGILRPPLDALLPRLVEQDERAAAGAPASLRMQIGMIAGPAVGGVMIAAWGVATTYGFDVATFVLSLVALSLMRAVPPPEDVEPVSLRAIAAGFRYATTARS